MVFTDLPLIQRIERIHDRGFQVEIWNWTTKDIEAFKATGATFSSMTGYISGSLTHNQDELLRTAEQSIETAHRLDCPRLNLHGTELNGRGLPVVPAYEITGEMWLEAHRTLEKIAKLGEQNDVRESSEHRGRSPGRPVRQGQGHDRSGRSHRSPESQADA